jgi:signal peptidase
MLSRFAGSATEQSECLRRVLRINPENPEALAALERSNENAWVAPRTRRVSAPSRNPRPDRTTLYSATPRNDLNHVDVNNPDVTDSVVGGGPNPLSWIKRTIHLFVLGILSLLIAVFALAILPMFMGYRSLVIQSGSMEPSIGTGSVVIAEPVPSNSLRVGDVIAYSPNPDAVMPIVHRIVSMRMKNGAVFLTTRGDANKKADTAEISLPPTAWRIAYNIPLMGYLISSASGPSGSTLFILVPVVALIGLQLWEWIRKTGYKPVLFQESWR